MKSTYSNPLYDRLKLRQIKKIEMKDAWTQTSDKSGKNGRTSSQPAGEGATPISSGDPNVKTLSPDPIDKQRLIDTSPLTASSQKPITM